MKFLNLAEEYQKYQNLLRGSSGRKENLMTCLARMNTMPELILESAQRILTAVSEGRNKIKPEEIKEMLMGNEQWKSMIECSFAVEN